MDTVKSENRNFSLIIGIGIFTWISILSFANLIGRIIQEISLNLSLNPSLIFWTIETTILIICILGILWAIKIINKSTKSVLILFRNAVLVLLIIQSLGFAEPFISTRFWDGDYLKNIKVFNELRNGNILYQIVSSILDVIKLIIIALLLFKKK